MNKKLLCTAVGVSLALAAGPSQSVTADHWGGAFIPYVVKDTNRTTVVTVIMHGSLGYDAQPAVTQSSGNLHLQYWTKSATDANTAACQPNSVTVPVTQNDIVTFDTAGILGYPLFGDTTNPAAVGTSISYAAPRHGYLMVQSPAAVTQNEGNIWLTNAYWLELDLANGGAHGDMAKMSRDGYDTFGVAGWLSLWHHWQTGTAVNFWPSSAASTVFTVTPLGTDMVATENHQSVLQVLNNNLPTPVQGAYDRNENGVDGTVPQTVRCVGRLTPAQLMPGVVANAAWAKQGGWGNLVNLGSTGKCYDNRVTMAECTSVDGAFAMVYQVDTSMAGGKFMDNATNIRTWNW